MKLAAATLVLLTFVVGFAQAYFSTLREIDEAISGAFFE